MKAIFDARLANVCHVDREGIGRRCPLDQARDVNFEESLPVRRFPAHQRQGHMPGFYWFATTGRHVPYESRLEMSVLVSLDFDPEVVAVAAQPFRLEYSQARTPRQHVPDFFVALRSGQRRVIDVKPVEQAPSPANQAVFDLTRCVCGSVGWEYAVVHELEPVYWANLSWLAGYRRRPADPFGVAPALIERCASSMALSDLVAAAGVAPSVVRPVLFHLLWSQVLVFDLSSPLDGRTVLRQGDRCFYGV